MCCNSTQYEDVYMLLFHPDAKLRGRDGGELIGARISKLKSLRSPILNALIKAAQHKHREATKGDAAGCAESDSDADDDDEDESLPLEPLDPAETSLVPDDAGAACLKVPWLAAAHAPPADPGAL